jgi:hypothetical protein
VRSAAHQRRDLIGTEGAPGPPSSPEPLAGELVGGWWPPGQLSLDPWTGKLIVGRGDGESAFCAGRIGSVKILIFFAAEGTFGATISWLVAGYADLRFAGSGRRRCGRRLPLPVAHGAHRLHSEAIPRRLR